MLSLTRQVLILLIGFVALAALAVALTSYSLLTTVLEGQIEARLDLGTQHTEALWQVSDLQKRQILEQLAQRPTLARLLQNPIRADLDAYLATFQANTDFDFLYLLDAQGNYLAGVAADARHYTWDYVLPNQVRIIAGIHLDAQFFEHLAQDSQFAYAFPTERILPKDYRAVTIALSSDLDVEMRLSVADIEASKSSALWAIVGMTLITVGLSSLLGGFYVRQRIQPLWRLRESAQRMGEGDLSTPIVAVEAFTLDISTLRDTLESSRQRIASSLQEIQAQRDWANSLMQAIIEGIVTYKADGLISFHSESTAQIMQWHKSKIGRELDKVFRTASQEVFSALLPLEGQSRSIDLELDNGRKISVLVTRAHPLPSGETSLVLRDSTEEKRQRKAQAYYLANMSHEFRTPLSGMKASLELFLENLGTLSKDEEAHLLESIVLSVASLQSLIDNLLEGSKLEAQEFSLRLQYLPLEAILIDALRTMQPLLKRRQQTLDIAETATSLMLWADKTRMVQVLVNLLSNASKYSPIGTSIEIQIEKRHTSLWLAVADRGAGVPTNQREQIFRQFVRLETSAEADHSTGLGLSVVRGIVEAHGGQVGVLAREDGGSIFWLSIPMDKAGQPVS